MYELVFEGKRTLFVDTFVSELCSKIYIMWERMER